jgi:hypothetical protein
MIDHEQLKLILNEMQVVIRKTKIALNPAANAIFELSRMNKKLNAISRETDPDKIELLIKSCHYCCMAGGHKPECPYNSRIIER